MVGINQPNTIGSVVKSTDEYTKRLMFSILKCRKSSTLHDFLSIYYRKKHLLLKRYSRNTGFRTLIDYVPEKATPYPCRTLKNSSYRSRKIIS